MRLLLAFGLLAASGCTLVGYPAGGGQVPVPVAGASGPSTSSGPVAQDEGNVDGSPRPEAVEVRRTRNPGNERLHAIPDAVPVQEPLSAYGNNEEYEVFGTTYRVLETSRGYVAEGLASWYGEEFQGRPTSSLEPYDMYLMTAAHRTLPLPTYVEVTNLENGRVAVVRVNDRGPFHPDRIIDLSYVAARKLGIIGPGTARVRVRALEPAAR